MSSEMDFSAKQWFVLASAFVTAAVFFVILTMPVTESCYRDINAKNESTKNGNSTKNETVILVIFEKKSNKTSLQNLNLRVTGNHLDATGLRWCTSKTFFSVMNADESIIDVLQGDAEIVLDEMKDEDLLVLSRSFFVATLILGLLSAVLLAFPICTQLHKNDCHTTLALVTSLLHASCCFWTDVLFHYYVSYLNMLTSDGNDPAFESFIHDLRYNTVVRCAIMDVAVFLAICGAVFGALTSNTDKAPEPNVKC